MNPDVQKLEWGIQETDWDYLGDRNNGILGEVATAMGGIRLSGRMLGEGCMQAWDYVGMRGDM